MSKVFNQNEIFADTYQIIREIGRGGTGVVYLAYHFRLQKYVVIKRIHNRFILEQDMRDEADILKNLHHPYLPQVYDYIVDDDAVYTVIDYIEGTSFDELPCGAAYISENQLLGWMKQLAEVLEYLHTQKPPIVHSDIKPANIILRPDGSICLIDFNISFAENMQAQIKGFSESYAAPEQIQLADIAKQGKLLPYSLDCRSDIYSFGATFYWLCSGIMPNGRQSMYKLSQMKELGYSQPLMSILDKCMSWNRRERYADAGKLHKALLDLKKADENYLRYVKLRACSIIMSAILAAGGIFLLLSGMQEHKYISYCDSYSEFVSAFEAGENVIAKKQGLSLLNDSRFKNILDEQEEKRAVIFHALGDISVDNGDIYGAINYYKDALAAAKNSDIAYDAYYRDYVVALIEADNIVQAQSVMEEANNEKVSEASLEIMQAAVYMKSGNYDDCINVITEVIKNNADAELCLSACELAADAMLQNNLPEDATKWMERAINYKSDSKSVRKLAELYLRLAKETSMDSASMNYGRKAVSTYRKLYNLNFMSFNDYINCSDAQIYYGNAHDAIRLLFECKSHYDNSFFIDAKLAFAYYELADMTNAAIYCKQAVLEYDTLSANEQLEANTEYKNVCALRDQLKTVE